MRAFLLLAAAATLGGQSLEYTSFNVPTPGPSSRLDGTIVFDPPGNQLFLFGGQDNSNNRNDLWVYSVSRNEWRELTPPAPLPAPRFGHTLNYDPVRRRLILFGGEGAGFFSDIWAYDIAANQWRQLADHSAGPSRRYGHSGIYDAVRNRVVISHGFTDRGRFDDTWAFDLATNRWSDLSPTGTRPVRRCLHHAEYDRAGEQMLLFGGCASGFGPCPLGDLWSLDLRTNRWTELRSTPSPSGRQHYGIAFDERRRKLILFGGSGARLFNDTWEFDPATSRWTEQTIADPPAARLRVQGAYAPQLETVFFFGGTKNAQKTSDLLALRAARPPVANAFSQALGPLAPGQLATFYGENLGPAEGLSAALDSNGRLPREVAGTSIQISGQAAPILFANNRQINFQIPYELPSGSAELFIRAQGRTLAPVPISIAATAPGLHGVAYKTANVVTLFATGAGQTNPPAVTGTLANAPYPPPSEPLIVTIGGQRAEVLFAGLAPGTAGVLQINARLPENFSGPALPITLRIGANETTANLTVQE
ncbi:MAG: hypothetical protein FJW30_06950 [Acidobacteria bacterium]|nr:hypothetical protein [Acidobacteriota bacterium]